MTPYLRISIAASLTVVMAMAGCSKLESDPRTLPTSVRVAVAAPVLDGSQSYTGVIAARVQSDLGFRVAGKIVQRYVDAGQSVRIGQPLMRLDRTDLGLAITAQNETVQSIEVRATQLNADELRYRGLVGSGAVAASVYDQVKASAETANAQLAAARAQARVAANAADYSILVADADGTVIETLGEPGQVVQAGQAVVKLAHAGPREAVVNLPEGVRPALHSRATASLFSANGHPQEAILRQLSDSADPATRTFEARYTLGGDSSHLPLGTTVTIHLATEGAQYIKVPLASISNRAEGTGVWVLQPKTTNEGTVIFETVHIRSMTDEEAILDSGIASGAHVVALGAHLLHDGQLVRLLPTSGGVQ